MSSRFLGFGIAAAIVALAIGCGDDDGGGGTPDGGGMTSAPTVQFGEPNLADPDGFTIDPATAQPAMYACSGTATAPAPGENIAYTLRIEDFQDDFAVSGVCVKFYPDNVVPAVDTCDPATDPVTDASGQIGVMGPASAWYAYRVFPKDGPTPSMTPAGSVQSNEPAPSMAGGTAPGNSVSQATLSLIPSSLGFLRASGTAIVAGRIFDCGDNPVYGASVRLALPDGTVLPEGEGSRDTHYRFFDGDETPSGSQPWSHVDGLYAVGNVPVASGEVFVQVWGSTEAGAEPRLLGCEKARLFADTVTILNVGPQRSDGPACPGT